MFKLPKCDLPPKQYHERQEYNIECGKAFRKSLSAESFASSTLIASNFSYGALDSYNKTESNKIPFKGNPEWANRHFGAVNTVENSGCIAFVIKIILDFFGYNYSVVDIVSALEDGGYRKWKLSNNRKILSIPYLDLENIKSEFSDDDPIQECNSMEEVYGLYGEPVGIGGAAIAIDNVINYIANRPYSNLETRISSIDKVLRNLRNGIIVPARVSNSIYHDDDRRAGGHYVVLLGLFNGIAYVLDSSELAGIKCLPATRFFKAVTADESLIALWDLASCAESN